MKAERKGDKPEKTYGDIQKERTLAMLGKIEIPEYTEEEEQLNQICRHYGWKNQCEILVEECSEFIQAVSKCKRNNWDDLLNLKEELADVLVVAEQLRLALGRDSIDIIKKHKIKRQLERMEEE